EEATSAAQPSFVETGSPVTLPTLGLVRGVQSSAAPDDENRLIVCTFESMDGQAKHASAVYVSLDRGNSWMRTLVDESSDWVSEPSCASGQAGRAYFATSASDTSRGSLSHARGLTETFRSLDGGLTWEHPQRYPFFDWTLLHVSSSRSEADERVYLLGNRIAQGFGGRGNGSWMPLHGPIALSDDGLTFDAPQFPEGFDAKDSDRFGLFPLGAVSFSEDETLFAFGKLYPRLKAEYVFLRYSREGYRQVASIPLPAGTDG